MVLKKKIFFFKKPIYFFKKKTKIWTFWEILLVQSHSTANLLPLPIFAKFKIFFGRHIYFLLKKPKILTLNVLRTLAIPVACILQQICYLQPFLKTSRFFSRKPSIFWNKTQSLNILRILPIQSHSMANLLPVPIFEKFKFFFERQIFFWKTQKFNFERFENSCYSSRILRQNCYLQPFLKKWRFFSRKPSIFWKKPKFESFENLTVLVAFYGEFATFSDFKKNSRFFLKDASVFY